MADDNLGQPLSPQMSFASELDAYMKLREMPNHELVPYMTRFGGSTYEVIRNWRKGRTEIPLAAMPVLSQVLGMGGPARGVDDPTYIFRKAGLLPESDPTGLASAAWHVQRLELKRRELEDEISRFDRSSAVVNLVRRARESGEWAVGTWPVVAGPAGCRMHVEDRVDIRHVSGRPLKDVEVYRDPLWADVLRRAYASPATSRPRFVPERDSGVSKWTISHAEAPTLPRVRIPNPAVSSVCIYGLNIDSGANEVGLLISGALGYGFALTRDEAMEQSGMQGELNATQGRARALAHQRHLEAPPPAVVWSHHAPPYPDITPNPFAVQQSSVPVIYLREGPRLLRQYCDRWPAADFDRLRSIQVELDGLAEQSGAKTIDVEHVVGLDRQWERHLRVARKILTEDEGITSAFRANESARGVVAQRDPDVAAPFAKWLGNL